MTRSVGVAVVVIALTLGAALHAELRAAATVGADLWHAAGVARAIRGVQAPSFTVADLSGRRVSLEQHRGRLVMLYFWATW